jgi:oxygen-dependent protoporphyrinogen oxidase
MADVADVTIAGGGITGLATAYYLRRANPDVSIAVVEASERVGGKIRTGELAGVPVEEGPDTFLARVPWAVGLCRELGLEDELVQPATGRAYVWTRGRMHALPEGTVLGVPARLGPLARSGVLSRAGLARAALDLALPRSRRRVDPTIGDVVGGRFGREVVDRLVEPLLGGIHAGRADRLSLTAVAPQVAKAAERRWSLMRGLREVPPADGGPVFLGLRAGMQRLVDRLVERLDGVDIRLGEPLSSVGHGATTVLAVPAFAAAPLVRPVCPAVADELDAVEYASTATVSLAYPAGAVGRPLDGSGFLVPRVDGRLLTACTLVSTKWPDRSPPGTTILRAFTGRIGDDRPAQLDDAALVGALHGDLAEALDLRAEPFDTLVSRWPRALPQYDTGHQTRVTRMETVLAREAPHVVLAGAAYRGVGVAACIAQASEVGTRIAVGATAV